MSADALQPGWQQLSIGGKPVHILPPSPTTRFVVLDLHPVDEELSSANPIFTQELLKRELACVAPLSKRSWWSNRLCPEFDESITAEAFLLNEVLPWIETNWGITSPRIAVTGISMGGQGAIRLGFRYPKVFPVVAGIASALEYNLWYGHGTPIDEMYASAEACRQDTAILQLNPLDYPSRIWFTCDPDDEVWYRGNDRLQEKLAAYGVPYTADLLTEAGGHTWAYFNTMIPRMLDFVQESLLKENRRLV